MSFGVVVASRIRSSRLPAKALLPILGLPILALILRRLASSLEADEIVLATTDCPEDDYLVQVAEREGVRVYRGENEDVVARHVGVAREFGFDYLVRVTADCPFVDADSLDHCLGLCRTLGFFDLASTKTLFPVGIDYEIINAQSLACIHSDAKLDASDREHLTKYFYEHSEVYNIHRLPPPDDWPSSKIEYTVDTLDDYLFCKGLAEGVGRVEVSVPELIRKAEAQ